MYTSLHRALGVGPQPLSFALIDQAISDKIRETDDLDWKKAFSPPGDKTNEEFAKDVAAMSNSGGGLLVFGVDQVSKKDSAAGLVVPVTNWDEPTERHLRQVAASRIQPPVLNLGFEELTNAQGQTVVVMIVPASASAPHLVTDQHKFGAPYRNGAETRWMSEREIERAYRSRFESRDGLTSRLDALREQMLPHLTKEASPWFMVSAVPTQERPAYYRLPEKDRARDVIQKATASSLYKNPGISANRPAFEMRRGLRCWMTDPSESKKRKAIASVHQDGSIIFAQNISPVRGEDVTPSAEWMHPLDVHTSVTSAFALLRKYAKEIGWDTDYVVRVTFETDLEGPFSIGVYEHGMGGNFVIPHEHIGSFSSFVPVTAALRPLGDEDQTLSTVHDVLVDVLTQSGIESPHPDYVAEAVLSSVAT